MKQALQLSITLLLMLLVAVSLTAQKKPNFPQQIFGNGGRDIAKHIIQNKQGQYVIVGTTANWFLSNDDNIFFTKIDSTGRTLLKAIPIGGPRTEGGNSVVQTRDGGYVIAGFTDSVEQGKREAWLVKVSENGLRIWDTKISTPEDDEFTDVTEAPNGDLWMTGQSGGKLWVVKTDALGKSEKIFSFNAADATYSEGKALVWDAKGRYLTIVGSKVLSYQNGRRDLILLPFDTVGEDFLDEKNYPNAEGEDIVRDRLGNFGIVGTSYTDNKGDFLFMYVNADYDTITVSRFGKKGVIDKGKSIAQDENGHFVLVGETYEDKRYQTTEGWVHKIKSDGSAVSVKPQTFGTSGNDAFLDVITSEKGDIKAVGKKYDLKGFNSDGWLLTIPPSVSPQNKGKIDLEIKGDRYHDDEDSTLLRRGKHGFYGFWIENKDTNDVFGLVAKVIQTRYKQKADIREYEKLVIGTLRAKERRLITVPFYGGSSLIRDEWDFNIKFLAQKDTLALQHNFHISTRDFLRYKLDTTQVSFPTDIWAGRVVNFSFAVKNTGDLMAQNVQLHINPETGTRIKLLGKDKIDLDDIPVGETRTAHISFEVDKDFVSEVLLLPVFVQYNGVKYGVEYQLIARVHPNTISKDTVYVKKPVRLNWERGKDTLIVTIPSIPLELSVESDMPLNRKENIKIFINNNTNTGEKSDNVRLSEVKSISLYKHHYQLTFESPLLVGENKIRVEVEDGSEIKQAQLIVKRQNRPNLFVLTVGVDYSVNKNGITPLSYTYSDAFSIDSILKTQKGKRKIFEKVTSSLLVGDYDTRGKNIKQRLKDFASECTESDVFIILLSGHGGIVDFTKESIRFLGSDYDASNPETYLDYKTEIKAILDKTKGQKLLFLDACQKKIDKSASIEQEQLSEAIEAVIKATPAFRALLSCSKGQSSWEIGKYAHGAFTQAILEALRNQTVPCGENEEDCNANIDPSGAKLPNRFLTFQELANFVIQRVPTIVKEIGRPQMPTVCDDHPDEDIPIFWFDNN